MITRLGAPTGSSIITGEITVGTSPTAIPASPHKDRNAISIRNWSDGVTVYIGNKNVTVANGYPINPTEPFPVNVTGKCLIYGICPATQSAKVRYLELIQ